MKRERLKLSLEKIKRGGPNDEEFFRVFLVYLRDAIS